MDHTPAASVKPADLVPVVLRLNNLLAAAEARAAVAEQNAQEALHLAAKERQEREVDRADASEAAANSARTIVELEARVKQLKERLQAVRTTKCEQYAVRAGGPVPLIILDSPPIVVSEDSDVNTLTDSPSNPDPPEESDDDTFANPGIFRAEEDPALPANNPNTFRKFNTCYEALEQDIFEYLCTKHPGKSVSAQYCTLLVKRNDMVPTWRVRKAVSSMRYYLTRSRFYESDAFGRFLPRLQAEVLPSATRNQRNSSPSPVSGRLRPRLQAEVSSSAAGKRKSDSQSSDDSCTKKSKVTTSFEFTCNDNGNSMGSTDRMEDSSFTSTLQESGFFSCRFQGL
ncbi:hypothetical protein HDU86_000739 [Geranomyces michiganensis]|nr:hypothetical protein HDU86_000739 [Geranomyces michiganensis]